MDISLTIKLSLTCFSLIRGLQLLKSFKRRTWHILDRHQGKERAWKWQQTNKARLADVKRHNLYCSFLFENCQNAQKMPSQWPACRRVRKTTPRHLKLRNRILTRRWYCGCPQRVTARGHGQVYTPAPKIDVFFLTLGRQRTVPCLGIYVRSQPTWKSSTIFVLDGDSSGID